MATTFTLIETKRLASATNIVTFSSVPQTYETLVLKVNAQDNSGAVGRTDIWYYGNSDNYATIATNRIIFYDGTNKLRDFYASNQSATTAIPTAGNGSGFFSSIDLTVANYTNTSTNKAYQALGAFAARTDQAINALAGYNNTSNQAAVSSLSIRCSSSNNFSVGSVFSLYGLAKV